MDVHDVQEIGRSIFQRYLDHYDGEVQGCCLLIAHELRQLTGAQVVAGELTWYGGSCRRTHWWVEFEGQTVDPMGEWFLASEVGTGRAVAHRDQYVFDALLPDYERWRLARPDDPMPPR